MTTKMRLKKMEAQTGLDRPCTYCGARAAQWRGEAEYLQRGSVKLFFQPQLIEMRCTVCGCSKLCFAAGLDEETITFLAAYSEEEYRARCERRKIPDELERQSELFNQRAEDVRRKMYGDHYLGARFAGLDAFERYVAKHVPGKLAAIKKEIVIIKQELIAECTSESESK